MSVCVVGTNVGECEDNEATPAHWTPYADDNLDYRMYVSRAPSTIALLYGSPLLEMRNSVVDAIFFSSYREKFKRKIMLKQVG